MPGDPLLAVYYEHEHWFVPLFTELDRRGIACARWRADRHSYDPDVSVPTGGSPLVFNRMSPSAWNRGHAGSIQYTLHYLAHLEARGVRVFNGHAAFTLETSKALQIGLLARLGIAAPRTRVVSNLDRLRDAAGELVFPLLVKPNVGGSGAGIRRFESFADLDAAVAAEGIVTGPDRTVLLQEYHPPRHDSIVRVETLSGRYLYAIRVHLDEGAGYDLCPADICRTAAGDVLESTAGPAEAAKTGLSLEPFDPPAPILAAVERIARAAGLDVGGIEYLESARDGVTYFYDINALSNFIPQPLQVLGFDPTTRLVDA
ncbi:MAG: RimK family alpha-L-glutamate ligase, partial [Acidobacteriota bacterium]